MNLSVNKVAKFMSNRGNLKTATATENFLLFDLTGQQINNGHTYSHAVFYLV